MTFHQNSPWSLTQEFVLFDDLPIFLVIFHLYEADCLWSSFLLIVQDDPTILIDRGSLKELTAFYKVLGSILKDWEDDFENTKNFLSQEFQWTVDGLWQVSMIWDSLV